MYDLIIVGGGPAGMTATVYAARKKLNMLLLSKDLGGQPVYTSTIENYMGYQYIQGPELMRKFEEQVTQFPIEQRIGEEAVNIARQNSAFEVATASGERYQAKAVIVATGKKSRQLNIPGEEKLRGLGVSYCAVCDGPLFAEQKVAIIGGGNSALEAANDMVKIAVHVYLISNTPLTADQILVDRLKQSPNVTILTEHRITAIEGAHQVEGIIVEDLKTGKESRIDVGGIFVEIGLIPVSELASSLIQTNNAGEIEVNCINETGVPGLFAAGDVTNVPEKQIVVAAGEGAKAALQAHKYLQRL